MSIGSLTLRAYLRYAAPLLVLAAVALVPTLAFALRQPVPADGDGVRALLRLAWILAATAWIPQLVLVAGAAPLVRALVAGQPLSQRRALADGVAALVRALVPCAIAIAAIVLGLVALVVPGLLLLALLALTGASDRLGVPPPAALADSAAVVRAQWRTVVPIVALMIAGDLAVVAIAQGQLALFDVAAKPAPIVLAHARDCVRAVAAVLVLGSPLAACALAASYARQGDA